MHETSEAVAKGADADVARRALEVACSARDDRAIDECYADSFVDHVNSSTYHGTDGARRSVSLYRQLFPDLQFEVLEQVVQGSRVASRWQLTGTHRGRAVRIWGIVISRLESGKIVEDWAATDTLSLIRQLGLWRLLLLGARHWRELRPS